MHEYLEFYIHFLHIYACGAWCMIKTTKQKSGMVIYSFKWQNKYITLKKLIWTQKFKYNIYVYT